MEMTPEIESLLMDPIAIAIVIGSILGWILCVGLSMKWALALTADETPTLRHATFIAFFLAFAQIFAAMFVSIVVPGPFIFFANIGLFVMNLKILGAFAGVGIGRAFYANIVYHLILVVLFIALGFGSVYAFTKTVAKKHPEAMDQLTAMIKAGKVKRDAALQPEASASFSQSEEASSGSPAGSPTLDDLRNVFFSESEEQSDEPSPSSRGWFGSDSSSSIVPNAGAEQTQTFQPGKNLDNGLPFQVLPVWDTSKLKSNPFVE